MDSRKIMMDNKVTTPNTNSTNVKSHKKKWIVGSILLSLFLISILACVIYLSDYYHADLDSINTYSMNANIKQIVLEDDTIVYLPENADAGLVFYPGGKVEHTAYEPLMIELANEGILCILLKMPFHLAVFDINAAEGVTEEYPEIDNWYLGGHSLGGSMAASYLSKNAEDYEGIVLLGSYSTADLSAFDLDVLSIYGSEDLVLNHDNYAESISNLPNDYEEIVLEGGCHAYFGVYGPQEGDGTPTISNREQIKITVECILEFMR